MRKRNRKDAETTGISKERAFDISAWTPKTDIGRKIKAGEITNIDMILDAGKRIMEPEIVDALLKGLQVDLLEIGQSKGKFGGGKRTIWKTTQKKSKEGNKPSFTAMAVVGNKDGYLGIGMGKSKETMPAREKATKQAKLNIIKIKRGCGSWQCNCREPHSLPFAVSGKNGSSQLRIMPAPKGTGLCMAGEARKMLALAGVKDVYSRTKGQTVTRVNLLIACFKALKELSKVKVMPEYVAKAGIVSGRKENKEVTQ
ncbi:MAG TPA: 30S ribosomal protein S5 [Nanoarchaeota archaeon]|nr:30S ribosomal protein S5 [Nanoarchaeota archaeon]